MARKFRVASHRSVEAQWAGARADACWVVRGRWTITPTKFSNQYYKMLTKFEWTEKSWPGEPDRPLQYKNEGKPTPLD